MLSTNVPHWLVYVSGHGFGHWAQVAPILNMARATCPALRLTICSKVPRAHLQSRLHGDFTLIEDAAGFGMVMASALDVLPQQSMDAYRAFHADWDARLARETARIRTVQPSLLLSNVAYLPLAAAHVAGVPAIALCSLNWADIFQHYCGHLPDAAAIHQQILRSYQQARLFLRLTPAMPMTMLANQRTVGPIAHTGQCRREEVARKLALASDEKLVLVSMGGIATRLPMENWPSMSRIRWLVEAAWGVSRPDVAVLESLEMDFTDALASSDALLCKPGYGSFVEAVCHGIPVLYVSRQDWPEQPCLTAWLHQYGAGQQVRCQMLEGGAFEPALQTLLALPRPQPLLPSGIKEALGLLWGHCRSNSMASP